MPIQLDTTNYDFEVTLERNCDIINVITYFLINVKLWEIKNILPIK